MDEGNLVRRAKGGNREAFNLLVLQYQRLAFNVAYRILGSADHAAEATQEAFVSAFEGIARLRGEAFKAWLLRIVTNACYDILRRHQREREDSLDIMDTAESERAPALIDETGQPEAAVLGQELEALVQRGLATLPHAQRVAIVLVDIQGYSYQEVAQITGAPLGTVKSRISRGRRALRDYLLAQPLWSARPGARRASPTPYAMPRQGPG